MYLKNKKILCVSNDILRAFLLEKLGDSEHFHFIYPEDVNSGCFTQFQHYDYVVTDKQSFQNTTFFQHGTFHFPLILIVEKEHVDSLFRSLENVHILEKDNDICVMFEGLIETLDLFYANSSTLSSVNLIQKSSLEMIDNAVHQLERFVHSSKDVEQVDLFKVNLMAREILTNAVRHGNKNDLSKNVYISYFLWTDHTFRLVVQDEGPGFDYFQYLDTIKREDELRVQHRGIFLINSFAKTIIPEGNKISIEIKL